MKRSTLWSALLIAASVAACGGSDDNKTATTSSTTGDTTTTASGSATTTTATTTTTTSTAALPSGVTAQMVASGETAFKGGPCIACHGADAKGTALAPNLTDDT